MKNELFQKKIKLQNQSRNSDFSPEQRLRDALLVGDDSPAGGAASNNN